MLDFIGRFGAGTQSDGFVCRLCPRSTCYLCGRRPVIGYLGQIDKLYGAPATTTELEHTSPSGHTLIDSGQEPSNQLHY